VSRESETISDEAPADLLDLKLNMLHGDTELIGSQHRILFMIGELVAGGAEQQLCYLLQGMDRNRYRPALVVWNYLETDVNVPQVRALGVPIIGYPVGMSSHRKLYEFTQLTRRLAPEVVHSYSFYINFAASCAARAAAAIAIGSVRNELDMGHLLAKRPVIGRLCGYLPRRQISNSHTAAQQITGNGNRFKPKDLMVVSNGLDMDRFRDDPVPMGGPSVILGIGSLVSFKRWDRLLRVGQELKRRGISCVVQIAGDGPLRAELEAMAVSLDVADVTQFLGHRDDISDLVARARLVVHTSDGEGTPNAVMEGMASGRPVVATDAGDTDRLIEDGVTGFVVRRDDPDALLARIIEVIADDRLAVGLGHAAREFAKREFGLLSLVERTFDVYRAAGWKS
jgi:glycosyltransferase involved in cell wall biosynthesis